MVCTALAALFAACVVAAADASAQLSEGPNAPGSVVGDAVFGSSPWINPGNAVSSNDIYAQGAPGGSPTQYLKATNFGFSIPGPAQIVGIEARIERRSLGGTITDERVRIVKGGVVGSAERAAAGT
jgi:hypothetical protein